MSGVGRLRIRSSVGLSLGDATFSSSKVFVLNFILAPRAAAGGLMEKLPPVCFFFLAGAVLGFLGLLGLTF